MSESFENPDVWKRSKTLAVEVCRAVSSCKDWGFKDQIMRSSVSVPSNIAEGAERNGKKEFAQFLGIAKGSLGELRTQIMIGQELNYFDVSISDTWIAESRELSKMLHGLIRSLRDTDKR
jgi:four helix bundle protein